ncbi:hypothetical protein B0H65DRAFT_131276 [Neurospora tetraspora]|uniref:Uncharacterized protein n=1 Tax=Neurospora tetraspora TaxID=94610 RepID=A0AAE0JMI1_9PEZI|nr:hypothetical protein B0H65DRAFT_131276 [Neurospora tetraspora]
MWAKIDCFLAVLARLPNLVLFFSFLFFSFREWYGGTRNWEVIVGQILGSEPASLLRGLVLLKGGKLGRSRWEGWHRTSRTKDEKKGN